MSRYDRRVEVVLVGSIAYQSFRFMRVRHALLTRTYTIWQRITSMPVRGTKVSLSLSNKSQVALRGTGGLSADGRWKSLQSGDSLALGAGGV